MANSVKGNVIRVDTAGLVRRGGGKVRVIQLVSAADAATATIRDGVVGTDPIIWELKCPANDIRGVTVAGLKFSDGLFVDLTGTTPILYIIVE